jgi:hypothetical protein
MEERGVRISPFYRKNSYVIIGIIRHTPLFPLLNWFVQYTLSAQGVPRPNRRNLSSFTEHNCYSQSIPAKMASKSIGVPLSRNA